MKIKDMLSFKITWSDGKPFDPSEQKRTDAVSDLVREDNKRRENDERKKQS